MIILQNMFYFFNCERFWNYIYRVISGFVFTPSFNGLWLTTVVPKCLSKLYYINMMQTLCQLASMFLFSYFQKLKLLKFKVDRSSMRLFYINITDIDKPHKNVYI